MWGWDGCAFMLENKINVCLGSYLQDLSQARDEIRGQSVLVKVFFLINQNSFLLCIHISSLA